MLRSFFAKKNFPIYSGLAIGGALAYYLNAGISTQLRADAPVAALDPNNFLPLKIASSKYLSHDTKEIVLDLPEDHNLGGKTAYMVLFKYENENGKNVIRPYTPVSTPETVGSATFVIKAYKEGKMSKHIHGLNAGDSVDVKGPIQKYPLEANQHKKIGLIGGGTGITPLYQILQRVADDPNDKTEVSLYYGSNTPDDVLIKSEIDQLVAKKPEQLKVVYFASKANKDWKGEEGFITKDYLEKNLFKPSEENVKVFVCGPPPLYEAISGNKASPSDQGVLTGALKDLGFKQEQVFKF